MKNAAIFLATAMLLCGCKKPDTPLFDGAFGWKLGDKLQPDALVHTNDSDFMLECKFTPDKPISPFNNYHYA